MQDFEARQIANMLHAMAKAHYRPANGTFVSELERHAETVIGLFCAQDLANTLWAYATMKGQPGKGLMRALEGRAEAVAGTFNAQNVANTLWAYATLGREPGAGLMRGLEGRAEAVAGTFHAQNVANTLWAYATLGRAPGAGLMRGLEGRAEAVADTFNAQDVANTLWAACVFSTLCASQEARTWVQVVAQRLVSLGRPACFNTCRTVPAPSVLCVVPVGREAGCGMVQASAQRRASLARRMSFGVCARRDSAVSVPAASERDAGPHGAVGGGRGSLPDIRVLHRHARARQRPGDGRGEEQRGGDVGSGV